MVRLRLSGRADGDGSERSLDVDKHLGFLRCTAATECVQGSLEAAATHTNICFSQLRCNIYI